MITLKIVKLLGGMLVTITGVLTENLITSIDVKECGIRMSKEGLEKAKEIAKLMRKIKGYKYEYYTPDTPIQKMIKEERMSLNCHDKGSNSKQEE